MEKQIRQEVASTLNSLKRTPRRKLGLIKVFDEKRAEKSSPKSYERFEGFVLRAFNKVGHSYVDLVDLPSGTVEAVYSLCAGGDLTWAQAVTGLLSEVP